MPLKMNESAPTPITTRQMSASATAAAGEEDKMDKILHLIKVSQGQTIESHEQILNQISKVVMPIYRHASIGTGVPFGTPSGYQISGYLISGKIALKTHWSLHWYRCKTAFSH